MRRRRQLALVLTLGLVVLAVPASATDAFRDVPTSSPHHDAVSELSDAGVTAGCDDDRYCPERSVRRDQMASFLSRGLSRSAFNDGVADLTAETGFNGVPASTTVQATGTSGGTGTVVLQGVVNVYSEADVTDECPCEIEAFIFRDGDDADGPSSWTQLPAESASNGRVSASLPVHWAVQLPAGTTETFRVAVLVNDAEPAGLQAEASLSSLTAPFGDVPTG
jgi:hypothetical protein